MAKPSRPRPAKVAPAGRAAFEPAPPRHRPRQESSEPAAGTFERAVRQFNVGDLASAGRILTQLLGETPDQPDALHLLGVISAQRGATEDAARYIERALTLKPDDAVLRNNLASFLITLDRAADALAVIEPALPDNAHYAGLHYNRGQALRRLGRLDEAASAYRAALSISPAMLEAALNLAATLLDAGQTAEAERVASAAVASAPNSALARFSLGSVLMAAGKAEAALPHLEAAAAQHPEARRHLGLCLLTLGRADAARRTFERALADAPDDADLANNLGVALLGLDANEAAARRLSDAVSRQPNHAEAEANLSEALRRLGELGGAIGHGERATQLAPLSAVAWLNLGAALLDDDRPTEAQAALARAVALDPASAAAENNYGSALEALGERDAALAAYERALSRDPSLNAARFNRGLAHLTRGDYAQGFADYEARRALRSFPRIESSAPEWRGEKLAGRTLLLYAEQGFGDTLQFARFIPLVSRGGHVVLACQSPLVRLLSGMDGLEVVAQGGALPAHDLAAPLLSVPHILGMSAGDLPRAVPYIPRPEPMTLPESAAGLRIGIAWTGSGANRINRRRSCPLDAFAPLATLDGVKLYSLQVGPDIAAELARVPFGANVIDLAPRLNDFHDTASAIMALELIVTIDTSVAHLAGALGQPVWVMLSKGGDWRYGEAGADCAWYPSMRLFRQATAGDWPGVIEEVRRALIERLGGDNA